MRVTHAKFLYEPSQIHKRGNLSPIRPRQKMPTVYRHKLPKGRPSQTIVDDQFLKVTKDNSYLKKRLDKVVELQREKMLIMSGRTSFDNPQWMSTSLQYYKKMNYCKPNKSNRVDQAKYDVFNNERRQYLGRNEQNYFTNFAHSFYSQHSNQYLEDNKASENSRLNSLNHSSLLHKQVSQKVGSIERRDYTIPRPLLKIGGNNFIDTYSPF